MKVRRFSGLLPQILKNDSCVWCAALRITKADEERYCIETGEILPEWKKRRGCMCPMEDVHEIEGGEKDEF